MKQRCRSGAHVWDSIAEANRCCSPMWRRSVRVLGDPTLDGDPANLDAFGRLLIPCAGGVTLVVGWMLAPIRHRSRSVETN